MSPETVVEISFDDYEKVGGFKSAIDREAETVLALFPNEQDEIERLFQRITEKGEGEKPIRKPETLAALAELTRLDAARLTQIVNAFAARDLLVLRESEQEGIEVDLPHECLEWKWERLKQWIDQEAALAQSLEFLKESSEKKQWVTGSALAEALRLREHGWLAGPWPRRYLSQPELVAVKEWVGESEQRDKAEKRRLEAERLRGRRRAIAVTLAVLVLTIGGLIFFYEEKTRETREKIQRAVLEQTQREIVIFNKRAGADSLLESGEHQRQVGKYQDSLQSLKSALAAYKELNDAKGQVAALIDIGDVQALSGKFSDAESAYVQAGKMANQGSQLNLEGKALESLASLNEREGRLQEALKHYEDANQLYQSSADSQASGRVQERLAFEAEKASTPVRAVNLYESALKNYKDSGDELGKLRVQQALDRIQGHWGFLMDLLTGQIYGLKSETVNVGRSVEGVKNDISFEQSRMVSRRHLAINRDLHIDDMRSTNGTSINARNIPYGIGAKLSNKDIIVLGNVQPLQFLLKEPSHALSIPPGAWAVFIDGEKKSYVYLTAQEYSLAAQDGKLAVQTGVSKSAMLKLRQGTKPQMMVTSSSDWTVVFTLKQNDYEYKTYIARGGEWTDPLDVPLRLVKLSPDEKKILVEGPAFQVVFFQPIDQ